MKRLYDIFTASAGVSTDSRTVAPGSIFFALRGENFDGNRYAADALARGAAYAVVDDPRLAAAGISHGAVEDPRIVSTDASKAVVDDPRAVGAQKAGAGDPPTSLKDRFLVVENALLTLQHLAAHHRRSLGIQILAITGTNGKTTTKELMACVLARQLHVSVTRGNLNNHIGVPLTLLAMTRDTQLGIVEMGANALGEIRTLCEIAAPDYGLITNVGRAHLEGFGSFEGVKAAKGELYDYLAAHAGTAFVAQEEAELVRMAADRPALKTVTYSVAAASGIRSKLEGDYNRANIAAAVAVGRYFEVPEDQIRSAIQDYVPDNHRSQRVETARNTLILDCYNANPSSMRAAIDNFAAEMTDLGKTVILGDMHELGSYSAEEHKAMLQLLMENGIEDIYLVGKHFTQAVRDYPATGNASRIRTFDDVSELGKFLAVNPLMGRLVLIKGSRAVALEKLLADPLNEAL